MWPNSPRTVYILQGGIVVSPSIHVISKKNNNTPPKNSWACNWKIMFSTLHSSSIIIVKIEVLKMEDCENLQLSAVQSDPWTQFPFTSWSRSCSKHYRSSSPSRCWRRCWNLVTAMWMRRAGTETSAERDGWLWSDGCDWLEHWSNAAPSRKLLSFIWVLDGRIHLDLTQDYHPREMAFSGHLCLAVTSKLLIVCLWRFIFVVASSSVVHFSEFLRCQDLCRKQLCAVSEKLLVQSGPKIRSKLFPQSHSLFPTS